IKAGQIFHVFRLINYFVGDIDMHGVLPLWKPKGLTSHDCIYKLRRILKTKKVGHTGTLDPEVEGVLPICLGGATKIIPYLSDLKKVYSVRLVLGSTTDTEDATGQIVDEEPVEDFPSKQVIKDTIKQFTGTIKQIAPMYSAVRVKGKRLYEYARENIEVERINKQNAPMYSAGSVKSKRIYEYAKEKKEVERPERENNIQSIDLIKVNEGMNNIDLEVSCSKGTYIRTLCVDIGKKLGYFAHMSDLKRIESDSFKASETFTFSDIESIINSNEANKMIQIGRAHV